MEVVGVDDGTFGSVAGVLGVTIGSLEDGSGVVVVVGPYGPTEGCVCDSFIKMPIVANKIKIERNLWNAKNVYLAVCIA